MVLEAVIANFAIDLKADRHTKTNKIIIIETTFVISCLFRYKINILYLNHEVKKLKLQIYRTCQQSLEDGGNQMFDEIREFDDIMELPLMRGTLDDILVEPKEEDISKVKIPSDGRGFVFFPSHLKTYVLLKVEDPALAVLFLEDLISYGTTGNHVTNNPIIRGLMENITPILDNQYGKYLLYCARDKHKFDYYNHPEDRIHEPIDELINATKGVKL